MLLVCFGLFLGVFNRISCFGNQTSFAPRGSKVPHPRTITAILGGAGDQASQAVFNPGLTRVRGFPHATIRLTCGGETPAWRNLGECVSFESHSRHVHDAVD